MARRSWPHSTGSGRCSTRGPRPRSRPGGDVLALGYPAQETTDLRPPGDVQPGDAMRPPALPPVATGCPRPPAEPPTSSYSMRPDRRPTALSALTNPRHAIRRIDKERAIIRPDTVLAQARHPNECQGSCAGMRYGTGAHRWKCGCEWVVDGLGWHWSWHRRSGSPPLPRPGPWATTRWAVGPMAHRWRSRGSRLPGRAWAHTARSSGPPTA